MGKPIAVTDSSGNPIPFCYETSIGECTTDPTKGDGYIWVKVPYLPPSGDAKLYVHVGSNGATDGDQVFLLYDSLDSLSSKWEWGELEHGVGYDSNIGDYGVWFTGDANGEVAARSKQTFESPFIVEGLIYKNADCADHFIYVTSDPSKEWSWDSEDGVVKFAWDCDSMDLMTPSHDIEKSRSEKTYYFVQAIITPYESVFTTWLMDNPSDKLTIKVDEGLSGRLYVYFGADEDDTSYKSYWYWIRVRKYVEEEPTVEFTLYKPLKMKPVKTFELPVNLKRFLEPLLLVEIVYKKALGSKGLILAMFERPLIETMPIMSKLEVVKMLTYELYKEYCWLNDTLKKVEEIIKNFNPNDPDLTALFESFNLTESMKQKLEDFMTVHTKIKVIINSFKESKCNANATAIILEVLNSSDNLTKLMKTKEKIMKTFGSSREAFMCMIEEAKVGLKRNFDYLEEWFVRKLEALQEGLVSARSALGMLTDLLTSS